ncbi:RICIN domain-containing protein [Saccharothrix sp. S26]|uniref:RICIN domain-containing protein n=1 Tax=Saccharothrix sp. S26 TaxID=2907215 RepID=UPI001F1A1981|nr:RICIN domain-containing protein [Saccharothrix sp. S26]MCE6996305.1 RICIN domain-containing protein [Saccharothrix sp. S26]
MEPDPGRSFRVINVVDGLALDSGGTVPSGAMKVWSPDDSPNHQFRLTAVGEGYYKPVNRANGPVVDGAGATRSVPARRRGSGPTTAATT